MNDIDIKALRKQLGLTQGELAKRLGVHARTVQNWESGTLIPESKRKLLRLFTSTELKPQQKHYGGDDTVQSDDAPNIVPLMPIRAQGGSLNDFTRSVMEYDCEKVVSPIKGADFAMTVSGDSMSPDYPSGCLVLVKKIDERAFIDWGNVYVLDTINGVVVKKLMPVDEDTSKALCVSINPAYPPFEVSFEHVFGVYRVLMCMSLK